MGSVCTRTATTAQRYSLSPQPARSSLPPASSRSPSWPEPRRSPSRWCLISTSACQVSRTKANSHVWFGLAVGLLLAPVGTLVTVAPPLGWAVTGFVVGSGTIASHITADALTAFLPSTAPALRRAGLRSVSYLSREILHRVIFSCLRGASTATSLLTRLTGINFSRGSKLSDERA